MTGQGTGAPGPLALVGGRGALPAALVAALTAAGRDVVLCELEGFGFEGLDDRPRLTFRLETLADLLDALDRRGVREVCLAGAIRRPALDPARVTPASAPLVARLVAAMGLGDDGALRAVIGLFEEAGLAVRSAAAIAPDLLPPVGPLGHLPLPQGWEADLAAARHAHADLARRDAGQAVVARGGVVVAEEGPEGTDAMLAALADPAAEASPRAGAGERAGLLWKAPKAGQDRRADLPVIGPGTVRAAAAAGLAAIVIEAGGVMVLDRAECVALADAHGLALVVRK